RSAAVRAIAPAVLGIDVLVPEAGEYVADGAARQAAWVLARETSASAGAPRWELAGEEVRTAAATPEVRARYAQVRDMVADRPA
ncbi:MAG TPA: xylulose kinase, partial [Actinotalea sp.]|nr:xylulose kinase [Actinotalea sp.]